MSRRVRSPSAAKMRSVVGVVAIHTTIWLYQSSVKGSRLAGLRQHPSQTKGECVMPYAVDFNDVSTIGLESSPVAAKLAGLRAHEARYFKKKYDHVFTVEAA